MGNTGCINGTLNGANYSSPAPIIGFYVAAISFVCMLMMFYDITTAYLGRMRWLPCKSFSLNSITLTLMSIATKLPVDLTSSMPSRWDQLSKLSGTSFICIAMVFLMPSLGTNSKSECFSNMVALSIFVITVVVNICIQIHTGVISLFLVEHILILVSILVLLGSLWMCFDETEFEKGGPIDPNKDPFKKGNESLFQRVKVSHVNGYRYDPQFLACVNPVCVIFGVCCLICSAILIQAAVRSVFLKQMEFCSGNSDYDWSMPVIVMIQLLTVILGCFAATFRWLLPMIEYSEPKSVSHEARAILYSIRFSSLDSFPLIRKLVAYISIRPVTTQNPVLIIIERMVSSAASFVKRKDNDEGAREEFKDLVHEGDENFDQWIMRKNVANMEGWIVASKRDPPKHLLEILSKTSPSQELHSMDVSDEVSGSLLGNGLSSLTLVLLVRIAQVSIPNNLCGSLVQALKETDGIYQFIDKEINCSTSMSKIKLMLADAIAHGRDFSFLLPDAYKNEDQLQSDLDHAIVIISKLRNTVHYRVLGEELGIIKDYINRRSYSSIEDLYNSIEQLFVDILHALLGQLPNAIFRSLSDCSPAEYGKAVKQALKFLCKIEPLEARIQWQIPVGFNVSTLITTQAPGLQSSHDSSEEDDVFFDSFNYSPNFFLPYEGGNRSEHLGSNLQTHDREDNIPTCMLIMLTTMFSQIMMM